MARQHQDVVLLLLELEEVADRLRWGAPIGLHHQQHPGAGQPHRVQARHDLDLLVGGPGLALGLKQPGETVDQRLLQLRRRDLPGIALDAPAEVLGLLEVEGLALAVQVPGAVTQAVETREEFIGLTAGGGQVFDDFGLRQAAVGTHGAGQRGREHQLGDLGGCIAAQIAVDLLRAGVAVVGDVVDHGGQQRRIHALDLVAHLRVVEVQVLGADQEDVVGLAVPDAAQQPSRELHEAAGLAKAFVLLEQRDQVLERRMKRVGLADLLGDLLHRPCGDVAAVLGRLDLLGKRLRHRVD